MTSIQTRDGLNRARLEAILEAIPGIRAVVVGDFFLDRYFVTDPLLSERSVETGLEARQVVSVRSSPGAAGTVTNNLAALGVGSILAAGIIGGDPEGFELERLLKAVNVDTAGFIRRPDRFTPTYMKPMVAASSGERELERLDIKNRTLTPSQAENEALAAVENSVREGAAALIIADQVDEPNCGVITDSARERLCALAESTPGLVAIADSRARIGRFRGVCIKPNQFEAARATSFRSEVGLVSWEAAGVAKALFDRTGKPVFLTMGEDGIIVAEADSVTHISAVPPPAQIDIVGAGDSVTAGIACALCAGSTPVEAACLGNLCASITIRKLGTTGTATPPELHSALSP